MNGSSALAKTGLGACPEVNQELRFRLLAMGVWRAKQTAHPPCNGGGRIDPVNGPGGQRKHLADQQGIVRAGEHHGIGPRSIAVLAIEEAGGDFRGDGLVADLLAAQGGFGELARFSAPTSVTSQPCAKSAISFLVYSRFTVPRVPSTETRLVFDEAQAGLMAGTVPTNGTL
jgi:hypothetical protein